jgi:hypothetical protein
VWGAREMIESENSYLERGRGAQRDADQITFEQYEKANPDRKRSALTFG